MYNCIHINKEETQMLTKTRARRILKIVAQLDKLKTEGNKITDEIVELDIKRNQDEMQTAFWQNFQYLVDSIPDTKDEFADVISLCEMVVEA
jgi:Asp-tRNA(Asn)/Glu-tRNA(Gln) amidotransferase C subunit